MSSFNKKKVFSEMEKQDKILSLKQQSRKKVMLKKMFVSLYSYKNI